MASRAKKKWRYRQSRIDPELKRELLSTGLWSSEEVVSCDDAEERMSSVLLDFVAPYTATAESEGECRLAIQLGLIAWNMALLPPEDRREELVSLVEAAVPQVGDEFLELIDQMVARKEEYFADCRRMILAHHVKRTPRGLHLSVVSSVE